MEESPSTLLDKQIQVKEGASKREKALVRLGVQTTGHLGLGSCHPPRDLDNEANFSIFKCPPR